MKIKVSSVGFIQEDEVEEGTIPAIKIKVGDDAEVHEDLVGDVSTKITIRVGDDGLATFDEPTEEGSSDAGITIKVGNPSSEDPSSEDQAETSLVSPEPPKEEKKDKITIKVDDNNVLDPNLKNVTDEEKPTQKTMKLLARRAVNGDVMIFDHKDIDIVLKTSKNKIVAFPKEEYDDRIYETQLRLFEYLARKGIIEYDGIQGGTMLMSMEAKLLGSSDYNMTQIALVTIGKWIERERPYFEWQEEWEEDQERRLLEPEEGEYTEFNPDKYHSSEKGSIRPKVMSFGTPGIYRF